MDVAMRTEVAVFETDQLFVYGTLRAGIDNPKATRLARSATYMGPALVKGCLFRVSHYPALGPAMSPEDWVAGDLFANVPAELFRELDEFEGREYIRELAEVKFRDEFLTVYLYRYLPPVASLERIPTGDWKSTLQSSAPVSRCAGEPVRQS